MSVDQVFRVKVTTSAGGVTNANIKDAVEAAVAGSTAAALGMTVDSEDLRLAGIALRGQTKAEFESLGNKLNARVNRGYRMVAEADAWDA